VSTIKVNRIENTSTTDGGVSIDTSGNVGIGTTSPTTAITQFGGAASGQAVAGVQPVVALEDTTATTYAYFGLQNNDVYIDNVSAGFLRFATNNTERARIDSSGRLLVGTSNSRSNNLGSNFQFQIEGTGGDTAGAALVRNSDNGGAPYFVLGKTRATSIGGSTAVSSGDGLGEFHFTGSDGTNLISAAVISAAVAGTPGANNMPGRLLFSTTTPGNSSPTERVRIGGYGRIDTFDSSGACIQATSALAASTSDYIFIGRYAGTGLATGVACYVVYTNGAFQQLSDGNLKKNIERTRNGYLEDLNRLRVVKYNWKSQEDGDPKELGLVAQEVENIFPGLVSEMDSETENSSKGIKTSVLPYMLIKALQEATLRIETLEAKVAALEGA